EDMIVHAQQKRLPDGGGFLPDGEVRRAPMVVLDPLEIALDLDLVEHTLEGANDRHVPMNTNQVFTRKTVEFVLQYPIILIDRYGQEFDLAALANVGGMDGQGLGHETISFDQVAARARENE